ncbi:hypothetical protein pb186bvf_017689 [Paramecium bursaria]
MADFQKIIMEEESFKQIEVQLKLKKQESIAVIDENPQQILLNLKCFSELHNKERLAYAQRLAEFFEVIGDDAFRNLGFILQQFLNDSHSIQISLMDQIPTLINLIKKRQTGYQEMKESILPFLTQFLCHQDPDLKLQVSKIIIDISKYLDESERVELVLSKLVDLAHDDSNFQNRIIAAEMMGNGAQIFGQKVCESYICGEIMNLGMDLNENVRLKAIEQIPKIAAALTQRYIEQKVVPFLIEKCYELLPQIRVACVSAMPGLSKYSSHQIKIMVFIPQYISFLTDVKKDIRKIAFENLGLFISTIRFQAQDEDKVDKLLDLYSSMLDKSVNNLSQDSEMVYYCAFYFPGVLQAIGKERWPKIQSLYSYLLRYPSEKIRRPLAYGFHEVAKVLGPAITKESLIHVLEALISDKSQDIRNGIILNLDKFIRIFDLEEREYVIDLLLGIQKDIHKWRNKVMMCVSLLPLTRCFSQKTVFFQIAPILFKLCSDNVSLVRKKAAKNVYHLVERFDNASEELQVIQDQIRAFSLSKRFSQRQTYCWMCYKMFTLDFELQYFDRFLSLCTDPVAVVRLTALMVVDRYIQKHGDPHILLKEKKFFKYAILQFRDDTNKEIQNILSKYTFVIQKPRKKTHSIHSKKSSSSESQQLDNIPEFDEKIERIRKNSLKK